MEERVAAKAFDNGGRPFAQAGIGRGKNETVSVIAGQPVSVGYRMPTPGASSRSDLEGWTQREILEAIGPASGR